MLRRGMTCSIDLRERVVNYVRSGGGKAKAARRFSVSRQTVCNGMSRDNLSPKQHGLRRRKIDKAALARHVKDHPDALLRERAALFGVSTNAVWEMMRTLGFVKKRASIFRAQHYEKNEVFEAVFRTGQTLWDRKRCLL
jgi:putative transposase